MSALADLQRQFLAALFVPDSGTEADMLALIDDSPVHHTHVNESQVNDSHVRDTPVDMAQRFAIYRNNWRSNLRNALRAGYPVVERLVGEEFFVWLADNFIDQQPSHSGNLDDYGAEFPEFIRQFPALAELPYLGDVARLESLIDAVMTAPDSAGDMNIDVEIDAQGELPPPMRLLASPYPVHRIWQVNQPDWSGDDTVSLEEGGVQLLIQRRTIAADVLRYELLMQPLSDEQFSALQR